MDLYLENNLKITLDEYGGRLELWRFSKDKIWESISSKYFTDLIQTWKQEMEVDGLMGDNDTRGNR